MNPVEERSAVRHQFEKVIERLIAEYGGVFSAGTIIRTAGRAREELLATGVRAGLMDATESMTRQRLAARVPAHV